MNIAHFIASIGKSKGGPSRSVTHLLAKLGQNYPKMDLQLHTTESEDSIISYFEENNVSLTFYKSKFLGKLEGLSDVLLKSNNDLYHGQAIWDLPIRQMVSIANKKGTPYVISTRGMLEPWALKQNWLKKRIALGLYQYDDLKNAFCIHTTASMEAQSIRALGLKNPIAVIPNGVPLDDFPLKVFHKKTNQNKILFLSRIHPKKGVEILIEAWSQLSPELVKEWTIDIIGNGEVQYIARLKRLIHQKGLDKRIFVKEPIYGVDKVTAYHEADVFVLPTYSENFGIVVAEALACGIPVITTHGTPWKDLVAHDCGWHIEVGIRPLVKALECALSMPKTQIKQMGLNGRSLVVEKYSITAVAHQMHELYNWILNKNNQPSFVRLD